MKSRKHEKIRKLFKLVLVLGVKYARASPPSTLLISYFLFEVINNYTISKRDQNMWRNLS